MPNKPLEEIFPKGFFHSAGPIQLMFIGPFVHRVFFKVKIQRLSIFTTHLLQL
ncbi:hypothetical protein C4K39_4476 [Pseudomonas sessilinigenes]|nr:hypothetical protein C4K39_4476 [Pseudomonas sessilinigenes]